MSLHSIASPSQQRRLSGSWITKILPCLRSPWELKRLLDGTSTDSDSRPTLNIHSVNVQEWAALAGHISTESLILYDFPAFTET